MTHSHMPVRHLMKQIELFRENRKQRDLRPEWVTQFIDQVADLFEPIEDVGRVGFDCRMTEKSWLVALFLGSVETVGGRDDGHAVHAAFEFDLNSLLDLFTHVDQCRWHAFPQQPTDEESAESTHIAVDGHIDGNSIRVEIHSVPPSEAGPGFHQYPNGQTATA